MTIKQSVLNTFDRVGIDYKFYEADKEKHIASNRFGGGECKVSRLVFECIQWVYNTSNAYERGDYSVKVGDFDRIRYFVAEVDPEAYRTCLD